MRAFPPSPTSTLSYLWDKGLNWKTRLERFSRRLRVNIHWRRLLATSCGNILGIRDYKGEGVVSKQKPATRSISVLNPYVLFFLITHYISTSHAFTSPHRLIRHVFTILLLCSRKSTRPDNIPILLSAIPRFVDPLQRCLVQPREAGSLKPSILNCH